MKHLKLYESFSNIESSLDMIGKRIDEGLFDETIKKGFNVSLVSVQ